MEDGQMWGTELVIGRNLVRSPKAVRSWMIVKSLIVREVRGTVVVIQMPIVIDVFEHGFLTLKCVQ